MSNFKVIVIGGGLAGALLANGLINKSVDVTVYERDAYETKREGFQIRLGEAAMTGFKACLTEHDLAAIRRKFGQSSSASSSAPMVCDSQFKILLDMTQFPSYSKSAAINRVALRNLLIAPVHTAERVKFEKIFSHYEIIKNDRDEERVEVHFTDGSTDTCDVLIGADGSGSKINKQLGARNIVEIDSHWTFLKKGSLPVSRIEKLPRRLLKGPIITFSKGVALFYALYLPASKGDRSKADHELNYDVEEASFYWGLTVRRDLYQFRNASEIQEPLQLCLDAIRDWAPEYHTMLSIGMEEGESENVQIPNLRASNKLHLQWRENLREKKEDSAPEGHPRVWLIGDAVHPMQPNRGMGGNQALQDCADILPPLVDLNQLAGAGVSPSTLEIQQALRKYEKKMIKRAFAWVMKSGGASIKNINLDGVLGWVVFVVGMLLIPLVNLYQKLLTKTMVKND